MKTLFVFLFISTTLLLASDEHSHTPNHVHNKQVEITPTQLYNQAALLDAYIEAFKHHFGVEYKEYEATSIIQGDFKPHHIWQLIYMINVKINIFRKTHHLPRIEEVGIEPLIEMKNNMAYGMLQRQITEINIIRTLIDIDDKIIIPKEETNKTLNDVFNRLVHISQEMDIVINEKITPSTVFSQAMRLYKDVSIVLQYLHISDSILPKAKIENSIPEDAFYKALELIKQLQYLQREADIPRTNFNGLIKENIVPEDTFIALQMAIAEFQTIKAYLGLTTKVTPPAEIYEDKVPADVEQLIDLIIRRVELIKSVGVK